MDTEKTTIPAMKLIDEKGEQITLRINIPFPLGPIGIITKKTVPASEVAQYLPGVADCVDLTNCEEVIICNCKLINNY